MTSRRRSPADNSNFASLPEEVLLRVVANHLMDIVIVTDAELDEPGPRIVYANDRFTELTGYSADEVLGRSPRILQGPETDPRSLRRIRQALEAGIPVTETVVNYARDGTRYDLELRIVPLVDGTGRPTHFVAIQRDVTRELARRAQRERMELLLASIVHSLDFGVLVYDESGRCVVANSHVLGLLGSPVDDVIGSEVTHLLPGIEDLELDAPVSTKSSKLVITLASGGRSLTVERLRGLPGMDRFRVLRVTAAGRSSQAAEKAHPAAGDAGAEARQTVIAGRMQLVGLDAIRKALGSRWKQRSEGVFELAQGVLRRRLGPRDVWRRVDDEGFIVAFAEADENIARFRAAAIADEIRETLIGSGETEIGCTSITTKVEMDAPVDIADDSILAQLEQSIDAATAELEKRVRRQIQEGIESFRLEVDDVILVKRGQPVANRVRLDEKLAADVLDVRNALEDPGDALLDVQTFLLAQCVKALTRQSGADARPLIVPFDSALTDSRRTWSRLLDVTRRIAPPLRKRMVPLIEGVRPQDGAYRVSDMAVTLGQIFTHPGLVHPTTGPMRFIPERCRLRTVIFRADELPTEPEEQRRLTRLMTEIRMTRAQIGIDGVRRYGPAPPSLPPHDLYIAPAD